MTRAKYMLIARPKGEKYPSRRSFKALPDAITAFEASADSKAVLLERIKLELPWMSGNFKTLSVRDKQKGQS